MRIYVGLADDPNTRRTQLGDVQDWKLVATFKSESEALAWRRRLELAGRIVDREDLGWGAGYTFSRKG